MLFVWESRRLPFHKLLEDKSRNSRVEGSGRRGWRRERSEGRRYQQKRVELACSVSYDIPSKRVDRFGVTGTFRVDPVSLHNPHLLL